MKMNGYDFLETIICRSRAASISKRTIIVSLELEAYEPLFPRRRKPLIVIRDECIGERGERRVFFQQATPLSMIKVLTKERRETRSSLWKERFTATRRTNVFTAIELCIAG